MDCFSQWLFCRLLFVFPFLPFPYPLCVPLLISLVVVASLLNSLGKLLSRTGTWSVVDFNFPMESRIPTNTKKNNSVERPRVLWVVLCFCRAPS